MHITVIFGKRRCGKTRYAQQLTQAKVNLISNYSSAKAEWSEFIDTETKTHIVIEVGPSSILDFEKILKDNSMAESVTIVTQRIDIIPCKVWELPNCTLVEFKQRWPEPPLVHTTSESKTRCVSHTFLFPYGDTSTDTSTFQSDREFLEQLNKRITTMEESIHETQKLLEIVWAEMKTREFSLSSV